MPRQALAVLCASLTVLAVAPPARAWDDYGHELIAFMAYEDLKPEVRARVNALLKQHPQYDALVAGCPTAFDKEKYAFMKAATWPDMIRTRTNPLHASDHHARWHYINIPIDSEGAHGRQPPLEWKTGTDPENAVQALQRAEAGLKNAALPDSDKAKDLCWLLHVGGDLHQPLHAVNLYSNQYPKGDEGGNAFWVSDGHRPQKLHALWDQALGTGKDATKIAARGTQLRKSDELTRKALADRLVVTSYGSWAHESVDLSRTVVYVNGTLKGAKAEGQERAPRDAPELPAGYRDQAEKLAERQTVLAGYRLADKLNAIP